MGRVHNPFPASLRCESKKATRILESFVEPPSTDIPGTALPKIDLANAKGLVIFTVFRVGLLGSARFGSGIMVARLDNGSWSAPSAIAIAGAGFGVKLGIEMSDFVFALNDQQAVDTFSRTGSVTLGGNASFAAGSLGRSVEVVGTANTKGVASTFAYSKTKGIFAGVTIEGSALIERKSANQKLYRCAISAAELLKGSIPPPPEVQPLMDILATDAFYPKDTKVPDIPDGINELPSGVENQPPSELPTDDDSKHNPLSELDSKHCPVYELDSQAHPVYELHAESSPTLPVKSPIERPAQCDDIKVSVPEH